MFAIVQNGLMRGSHLGRRRTRLASIQIALPSWKAATGYVESDTMPLQEAHTRRPQIDLDFVCLTRRKRRRG